MTATPISPASRPNASPAARGAREGSKRSRSIPFSIATTLPARPGLPLRGRGDAGGHRDHPVHAGVHEALFDHAQAPVPRETRVASAGHQTGDARVQGREASEGIGAREIGVDEMDPAFAQPARQAPESRERPREIQAAEAPLLHRDAFRAQDVGERPAFQQAVDARLDATAVEAARELREVDLGSGAVHLVDHVGDPKGSHQGHAPANRSW